MPTWKDLLDLSSRLEPRLAREYLAAIARLRAKTDTAEIAQAISEDREYFIPAAQLPLFEEAMDPAIGVLNDALRQGGQLAADQFTDGLGIAMRFDLTNPLAVQVARETAAGMVTAISAETRLAIQNVIRRAIAEGLTYRDAAALIRQLIGLTSQASQAAMNYRQSLLELGLARDKVRARVEQYAAKKLRERALTIARTEIMQASLGGQRVAWWQAERKGLLSPETQREWLVAPDDRLCVRCQAMSGKRVALYASFAGGNPPRHPRCRCVELLVIPAAGSRRRAA